MQQTVQSEGPKHCLFNLSPSAASAVASCAAAASAAASYASAAACPAAFAAFDDALETGDTPF